MSKRSKVVFPQARIKKMMQSDEEVGKIAKPVPVMMSKGIELFLEQLTKAAVALCEERNGREIGPSHFRAAILANPNFDFLTHLVENVPDLPENTGDAVAEVSKKRVKKQPSSPKAKRVKKIKKEILEVEIIDDSPDEALGSPLEVPEINTPVATIEDLDEEDEEDWDM